MNARLLLFLILGTFNLYTFAQGDDCAQALYLPNVQNYCSTQAQYTNAGSTTGSYGLATCWGGTQTEDVWFSFIATGTDVLTSVSGNGSDGTIINPRMALYQGTCGGTLTELNCTNTPTSDVAQIYEGGLIPGQTYLIRVSTTTANEGTFQLCVNSYTQPVNPGADCDGALYLCDNSTVSLASFSGGGLDSFEPEFTSCMSIESNSVWYYWQCGTSGTFTFEITPSNPTQDIDYIFYQLSSNDVCGSRTISRCNTSACLGTNGVTGLSATDGDVTEDPGCDIGENAYCSQVNLVAGNYYAILIDNATGNAGFSLSFGGTAQFTGPNPVLNSTSLTICNGETVTFDGVGSTNIAGGLNWTFSTGSSPTSATGVGPHVVTYNNPGSYVAILNGSDGSCQNTLVANVTVNSCNCPLTASNSGDVCQGVATFNLFASTLPGVTYSWTGPNGFTSSSQNPTAVPVPVTAGSYDYTVTVAGGGYNCSVTTTLIVKPAAVANAGNDLTYCSGSTPTVGTPLVANMTYAWSPSTGLSSTSIAQPTVTTTNSGSSTVSATYTLTVTNSLSSCTATDQVTVNINPIPSLTFAGDQVICEGECTDITVSGADFYVWAASTGITDPSAATQNFCPSGTATYDVTGYITSSNFVTNGDFSGGNVGFTSDYTLSSDTQVEGTYFVTTNANLTHPGFTGVDHTTGSGNFMVVNGSSTPNTSVWCQTVVVQPNTDYVFSTWVSTLAIGTQASLQFSINGTNLGSPFTAPANTNVWDEFYTTWNSGSATSATICIVNLNTSLGGNDFGIDDITFSSFCTSTESVTITVNPLPNIDAGQDLTLCEGNPVTLSASNGVNYSWTNGVVNGQSFVPATSGSYTVTGTDANGCVNTDDVTVTLVTPPTSAYVVDSLTGYPVLEVNFTNTSQDATSFIWNFGNGQTVTSNDLNGQTTSYSEPGTYTTYLVANNGYCTDTSTLNIIVIPFPDPIISVPNVFTPNEDGGNDVFFISTTYVATLKVTIINRWGNLMAEYDGVNGQWDGTVSGEDASEGVYFFIYEATGINGKVVSGHGNITLIR
jgi:gliding motility-associated-like protein